MYTITTNKSGTRSIAVGEEHLCTIEKYQLFTGLVGSSGIVDEEVLDKLKLTVRSLIASQEECKDLLNLCVEVLYHDNMKALGLGALMALYGEWMEGREQVQAEE
ncbi:MAG: hypothetical protein IJC77_02810 [Bacteroidaceae bacterium]|nr:hypothetical protein [Bacteroidaceae bacterium]